MKSTADQLAWNLTVELRKELVESQKIRAQIIGFKITFVTTAIGLVVANLDKVPSYLLVIAPVSAMFFDLLITSYSFSIKRIGHYLRTKIEPYLKSTHEWPVNVPLWEEFMTQFSNKDPLARWGQFGITAVVTAVSAAGLVLPIPSRFALPVELRAALGVLLLALVIIISWRVHRQFRFDGIGLQTPDSTSTSSEQPAKS